MTPLVPFSGSLVKPRQPSHSNPVTTLKPVLPNILYQESMPPHQQQTTLTTNHVMPSTRPRADGGSDWLPEIRARQQALDAFRLQCESRKIPLININHTTRKLPNFNNTSINNNANNAPIANMYGPPPIAKQTRPLTPGFFNSAVSPFDMAPPINPNTFSVQPYGNGYQRQSSSPPAPAANMQPRPIPGSNRVAASQFVQPPPLATSASHFNHVSNPSVPASRPFPPYDQPACLAHHHAKPPGEAHERAQDAIRSAKLQSQRLSSVVASLLPPFSPHESSTPPFAPAVPAIDGSSIGRFLMIPCDDTGEVGYGYENAEMHMNGPPVIQVASKHVFSPYKNTRLLPAPVAKMPQRSRPPINPSYLAPMCSTLDTQMRDSAAEGYSDNDAEGETDDDYLDEHSLDPIAAQKAPCPQQGTRPKIKLTIKVTEPRSGGVDSGFEPGDEQDDETGISAPVPQTRAKRKYTSRRKISGAIGAGDVPTPQQPPSNLRKTNVKDAPTSERKPLGRPRHDGQPPVQNKAARKKQPSRHRVPLLPAAIKSKTVPSGPADLTALIMFETDAYNGYTCAREKEVETINREIDSHNQRRYRAIQKIREGKTDDSEHELGKSEKPSELLVIGTHALRRTARRSATQAGLEEDGTESSNAKVMKTTKAGDEQVELMDVAMSDALSEPDEPFSEHDVPDAAADVEKRSDDGYMPPLQPLKPAPGAFAFDRKGNAVRVPHDQRVPRDAKEVKKEKKEKELRERSDLPRRTKVSMVPRKFGHLMRKVEEVYRVSQGPATLQVESQHSGSVQAHPAVALAAEKASQVVVEEAADVVPQKAKSLAEQGKEVMTGGVQQDVQTMDVDRPVQGTEAPSLNEVGNNETDADGETD